MYQNTLLRISNTPMLQYYYAPMNDSSIFNDVDNDPLTQEEVEDIMKSMRDIESGKYVRLTDKVSIASHLEKLKQ